MTCNKFAYNNHGLNINLDQDEQEVTVKRISLWRVALLIDNQRTNSYQHDVCPKKNWCFVPQINKQSLIETKLLNHNDVNAVIDALNHTW